MTDSVLEYRAALARNRDIFLIEHSSLLKAFSCISDNFEPLLGRLSTSRSRSGKSQVSLLPFVALLQRQSAAAFEAFASFQSFHGWTIIRPGIEAALMVGKFVDDRKFFEIWKNRASDRKSYARSFTGAALKSNSLRDSSSIQSVLFKVNDDFVHANPEYYYRHLDMAQQGPDHVILTVHYFDDDSDFMANTIAVLHLVLVIQESLAKLLSTLYAEPLLLRYSSELFRVTFRPEIRAAISKGRRAAEILEQFGLIDKQHVGSTI